MSPGDALINGGNEWYENTERYSRLTVDRGILYLGMGVSRGEEGSRLSIGVACHTVSRADPPSTRPSLTLKFPSLE
ncbi:hypothetical protein AAC387_Pa05g3766 [Persea americana]